MNLSSIGLPQRLPTLLKNTGTIARNYGQYVSQNHTALRANVLIFSSLILVLSRIGISRVSAKKAQGSPDGAFRYREFIRTFIREAAGWTLSFLLLRSIERVVRLGIQRAFQISLKPPPEVLKATKNATENLIHRSQMPTFRFKEVRQALFEQFEALFKGEPLPPVADLSGKSFYNTNYFSFQNTRLYNEAERFNLISAFSPQGNKLSTTEKMQNFFRYAPILVGSIPAIFLSGYALERFNIDHSQKIFDALTQRQANKRGFTATGSSPFNSPSAPSPSQKIPPIALMDPALTSSSDDRFNAFLSGVHFKQQQREQHAPRAHKPIPALT
jgi:hypothetical protein